MRVLLTFLLLVAAPIAMAHAEEDHPRPFDENFDAMPVVDEALAEARENGQRLLLVLGANWCHDSRGLAHHFQDEALGEILETHYVLRFIDVGWRDQNHAVMNRFGIPAIYGTPTVFVIDPETETLLNRLERSQWTSAASTPIEEARGYFQRWASQAGDEIDLVESSLIYQSLMIEIDLFEEDEGERLATAYIDVGRWRELPRNERPDDYRARLREADEWRWALAEQISSLRQSAYDQVEAALAGIAGERDISVLTVEIFDRSDVDIDLDFVPHDSEAW